MKNEGSQSQVENVRRTDREMEVGEGKDDDREERRGCEAGG